MSVREVHPIDKLRQEQRRAEFRAAQRSLIFLVPFLSLVVLAALSFARLELIDPGYWFILLFPCLFIGWWFGSRPLAKIKRENGATLFKEMQKFLNEGGK